MQLIYLFIYLYIHSFFCLFVCLFVYFLQNVVARSNFRRDFQEDLRICPIMENLIGGFHCNCHVPRDEKKTLFHMYVCFNMLNYLIFVSLCGIDTVYTAAC